MPTAKNGYLCDMRTDKEPIINIGIMSTPTLKVTFHGLYKPCNGGTPVTGEIVARVNQGGMTYAPEDPANCHFELHDVTIGVGFHWERLENQRFLGALKILPDKANPGNIIAVNSIGLEEYLKSVISSEMSATASMSLLKAHAVVSRSWLMRQLADRGKHTCAEKGGWKRTLLPDGREVDELVKWYDREDHTQFDVCADDHCQRYQGITRQTRPEVAQAVEQTRGETLTYLNEICDARFSKCCGGVSERFENCWENDPKGYLTHVSDKDDGKIFCDTSDKEILGQVLNDYDRETTDFFNWEVRYTPTQLSALRQRRSGVDFGEIIQLRPLETTGAGRIIRLLVEGSRHTAIVGKELEIRRWLSESHLRSSIFTVERGNDGNFILKGRGWGHGVGMCQIGAAVMGAEGYDYRSILHHYFPGADITRLYT